MNMKYIVYIKNRNIVDAGVICNTFDEAMQIYDEYIEILEYYANENEYFIISDNMIIDSFDDTIAYKIEIKKLIDL